MKLRGQVLVGVLLVAIGSLALMSNLLDIDFGAICWPSFFILLGVWIIVRPRMVSEETDVHLILLGDFNRSGGWKVADQEFWSFIMDANLDFTQADIPEGETDLKLYGFVSDIDILLPAEVGFKINSYGFVTNALVLGEKHTGFFIQPVQEISKNYATATKKINIDQLGFIGEVTIRNA
ncbi:MAG: LiaF-related protein [Anaerolineales bacterium]|jgi:predicted membrane protein